MKVIDLLNKIANGEEVPKKIRITILDDRITRKYNFFYDEVDQEYKDDELFPLGARLILERVLNEKVEIIKEDKEIEELPKYVDVDEKTGLACGWSFQEEKLKDKINELIDEVNKLKNKLF